MNTERTPALRRIARYLVVAVVVGGVLIAAFTFGYVADIRPDTVRDGISEDEAARGRQLVADVARSHGAEAWRTHETLEVDVTDEWIGLMGGLMNPFEVRAQQLRFGVQVDAWSARIELTNGPDAGNVWGVQDMNVYFAEGDGEAVFEPDHDISPLIGAGFLVPTFQYFLELALRIESATVVAWAGEAERDGERYDLVFATWVQPGPQRDVDQYVLWINRRSGRLDRVEFTIREMASSMMGAVEYDGFQQVDGVVFPGKSALQAVLPGGGEVILHVMTYADPRFDAVPVASLRPEPARAARSK